MNELSPELTRQVLHPAMHKKLLLRAAELVAMGGRARRPPGMPPATANPNMVEESYLGTDQRLKTDRRLA
jgi:hypothetical protein